MSTKFTKNKLGRINRPVFLVSQRLHKQVTDDTTSVTNDSIAIFGVALIMRNDIRAELDKLLKAHLTEMGIANAHFIIARHVCIRNCKSIICHPANQVLNGASVLSCELTSINVCHIIYLLYDMYPLMGLYLVQYHRRILDTGIDDYSFYSLL